MGDQQIDYAKLAAEIGGAVTSHSEAEARPIATGGGRGTGLDVRKSDKFGRENAPAIGAGIATLATGGTALLPLMAAAAGGGAIGSLARGDSLPQAMVEGGKQGVLEGVGGGIVKLGGKVARGLMSGTVPKNIAKNFDDVDIGQEMLNRGVVPGSKRSLGRVKRLSNAATIERDAAAQQVAPMSRSKVIAGMRPMYQKGKAGKVPEMSDAVLEQMRQSAREIGPEGLTGPEALARKDIKQAQGKAALNAADPRAAAFGSQLADAERGAIVSHLRDPNLAHGERMSSALDNSQALMAIDQVMQDAAHSNPVTRMRIGGPAAAAMTPIGLATTAHGINRGRQIAHPQVLRLLDMLMGQQ